MDSTYYHASTANERRRIERMGLEANNPNRAGGNGRPVGVYVWDSLAALNAGWGIPGCEVFEVEARGLTVLEDESCCEASIILGDVAPERVRFVGLTNARGRVELVTDELAL